MILAAGWAAKKYVLGPAYDAAKGLLSGGEAVATAGGEVLGPTLGDATSLLDVAEPVSTISGLPAELAEVATVDFQPITTVVEPVSTIPGLPAELTEVANVSFEPITTVVPDALPAIPDIPAELQQVADVNFEPVTQGISEATKQGIEEGMSQVDGDPLMKVVENSGKDGAHKGSGKV